MIALIAGRAFAPDNEWYKDSIRKVVRYDVLSSSRKDMSISKSPTKDGKKVTITFYIKKDAAQGASKIYLICEHNGWEPVAMKPMKNGTFRGSISVLTDIQPSYQYRFKYIMEDGEVKFDNDWDAEQYCPNQFGGDNSVFTVAANDE